MKKNLLAIGALTSGLAGCALLPNQPAAPVRATEDGYAQIMAYKASMTQEYAMLDWDKRLKVIEGASIHDITEQSSSCDMGQEIYQHAGNYALCTLVNKSIKLERQEKVCAAYNKRNPQGEIAKLKKALPGWDGDLDKLQNITNMDDEILTKVELTDRNKHYNLKMTNPQYEKCLKVKADTDCYLQYGTGKKVQYHLDNARFTLNREVNGYYLGTVEWYRRSYDQPVYTVAVKKSDLDSDKRLFQRKMYYVSTETVNLAGAEFPLLKKSNVSNKVSELLYSIIDEQEFAKEVQDMCDTLPGKKAEFDAELQNQLMELLPQSMVPATNTGDGTVVE